MRYFCAQFGQASLPQGLALHRSLLQHAGDFTLFVLTLDEATERDLREKAPTRIHRLPLAGLVAQHPALAAAQTDRTTREFALTCKPWLMRQVLPQLPPGELLTYLDPDLYFFSSPEPVFAEIGGASVAITPNRFPSALAHLERNGRFNAGWVSLRHDRTGLACAIDWADRCAAWCFDFAEPDRCAEHKYLDAWPARFPGTIALAHPGVNVAPWNLAGATITAGPQIDGRPLVCFHFAGLTHLGGQLYDPGLHPYDLAPAEAWRTHLFLPYLRELGAPDAAPDIVPPAHADDPRCGAAISHLLELLRAAERERAACLLALGKSRSEIKHLAEDFQSRERASERYAHQVEQDRNEQRQAYFDTKKRLEEVHLDLLHNIAYLKKLEAEAAAHRQASVDREAYVSSLKDQLAQRQAGGGPGPDLAQLHKALLSHGRDLRRLLVAHYHPALLPLILSLSAQGVSVEVLASPPEFSGATRGGGHFLGGSLWEWLGGLNSLFDEAGYLQENPDIAAAVTAGTVRSGWDHYLRFGQHEGRRTGTPNFRTGLADFDAVAFDSADASLVVPCLAGRLQPHQRLFVSSSFNPATVWLPNDTHRTILLGDLLCCPRPPQAWLGPHSPSALAVPHRSRPQSAEIYPETPPQPAVWPKISLVTASRNEVAGLEETLRSVLDQGYPNLEYIVVDGGSTDGSVEVIRRYSDRLSWWVSEPDAGPAQALNKGFAKSTGLILAWLDSGDRLAPGSLFTVAQQFLLHDPDLVVGRCAIGRHGNTEPRRIHRSVLALGRIQPLPLHELLDLEGCWLPGWFFCQPEVFVSRRSFERAGGRLDENLRQGLDYDLWIRLAKAGAKVLPIPEILAIHRPLSPEQSAVNLPALRAINAAHHLTA